MGCTDPLRFRKSFYAGVFATCDSSKGLCYVKNDAPRPSAGQLLLISCHVDDVIKTRAMLMTGKHRGKKNKLRGHKNKVNRNVGRLQ